MTVYSEERPSVTNCLGVVVGPRSPFKGKKWNMCTRWRDCRGYGAVIELTSHSVKEAVTTPHSSEWNHSELQVVGTTSWWTDVVSGSLMSDVRCLNKLQADELMSCLVAWCRMSGASTSFNYRSCLMLEFFKKRLNVVYSNVNWMLSGSHDWKPILGQCFYISAK